MTEELSNKIRQAFGTQTIYKDSATSGSLFDGRTLPSFVKDFLLKKYINSNGEVDKGGLTNFLDIGRRLSFKSIFPISISPQSAINSKLSIVVLPCSK